MHTFQILKQTYKYSHTVHYTRCLGVLGPGLAPRPHHCVRGGLRHLDQAELRGGAVPGVGPRHRYYFAIDCVKLKE